MIRKIYLQFHHMWHDKNYIGECNDFTCPRCKKPLTAVTRHIDDDMVVMYIGKTLTEIEKQLKKENED